MHAIKIFQIIEIYYHKLSSHFAFCDSFIILFIIIAVTLLPLNMRRAEYCVADDEGKRREASAVHRPVM